MLRVLYRATYSNVVFQQHALHEEVAGAPTDLIAAYVAGGAAQERCTRLLAAYGLTAHGAPQDAPRERLTLGERIHTLELAAGLCERRVRALLQEQSAFAD